MKVKVNYVKGCERYISSSLCMSFCPIQRQIQVSGGGKTAWLSLKNFFFLLPLTTNPNLDSNLRYQNGEATGGPH